MPAHQLFLIAFWIASVAFAQCVIAMGVALSSRVERGLARWSLLGVFVVPPLGVAGTATALAFVAYHHAFFAADWRGYTTLGLVAFLASLVVIARSGWRRLGATNGVTPPRAAESWRVGRIGGVAGISSLIALAAYLLVDQAQEARLREIVDSQRRVLERDLESTLERGPNVLDRYAATFEALDGRFDEYGPSTDEPRAALADRERLDPVLESARATAVLPDAVIAEPVDTGELLGEESTGALWKLCRLFQASAREAAHAGDLDGVLREREALHGLQRQLASARSLFRAIALPTLLREDRELLEILLAHSSSPDQVVAAWRPAEVTEAELLDRLRSHHAMDTARFALFFASALLGTSSDEDEEYAGLGALGDFALAGSMRLWRFIGGVEEVEKLVREGTTRANDESLRTWELTRREAKAREFARPGPGDGFLASLSLTSGYLFAHTIGDALASRAITRVALASVAYRGSHGRYPARLDDLVPEHLARVPEDPYHLGHPLQLAAVEGALLIFSVGRKWEPSDGPVDTDEIIHAEWPAGDEIVFALGSAYTSRYRSRDAQWREARAEAREDRSGWDDEDLHDEDLDDEELDDEEL